MKKHFLKFSIAIFLFSIHLNAQKIDESNTSLGNFYLNLYTAMEFDKMMEYYSDDSIFEDPTMSFFSKDMSYEILKGPKRINSFLKEGFKKITDPDFKIEKQFSVGVIHFYYGIFNYNYNIGKEGEPKIISFSLPLAIILTVRNNKIIHHQDIADYNVWFKQYNEQLKQ